MFGTSELAVATVLAAYMGGLALGAWLAERFLPRVTRPVLTYAVLELGIAASAIFAVPALLWLANLALQAMFGGQPAPPDSDHAATTLFYLVSAFVALALPTTLMGATLPMLARYAVAEEAQIGRRIGTAVRDEHRRRGRRRAAHRVRAAAGARSHAHHLVRAPRSTSSCSCSPSMLAQRVPHTPPPKGYAIDARGTATCRRGVLARTHSIGLPAAGLGAAADAAGRRRGVLPGSAVERACCRTSSAAASTRSA